MHTKVTRSAPLRGRGPMQATSAHTPPLLPCEKGRSSRTLMFSVRVPFRSPRPLPGNGKCGSIGRHEPLQFTCDFIGLPQVALERV